MRILLRLDSALLSLDHLEHLAMQFLALLTPAFFALQLAEVSAVTPTLQSIDAAQWNALNRTVNGRLYSATPIAQSCFSKFNNQTFEPDLQACAQVQSGYTSPEFRSAHYSAFMNVCIMVGDLFWNLNAF